MDQAIAALTDAIRAAREHCEAELADERARHRVAKTEARVARGRIRASLQRQDLLVARLDIIEAAETTLRKLR